MARREDGGGSVSREEKGEKAEEEQSVFSANCSGSEAEGELGAFSWGDNTPKLSVGWTQPPLGTPWPTAPTSHSPPTLPWWSAPLPSAGSVCVRVRVGGQR